MYLVLNLALQIYNFSGWSEVLDTICLHSWSNLLVWPDSSPGGAQVWLHWWVIQSTEVTWVTIETESRQVHPALALVCIAPPTVQTLQWNEWNQWNQWIEWNFWGQFNVCFVFNFSWVPKWIPWYKYLAEVPFMPATHDHGHDHDDEMHAKSEAWSKYNDRNCSVQRNVGKKW